MESKIKHNRPFPREIRERLFLLADDEDLTSVTYWELFVKETLAFKKIDNIFSFNSIFR
jgi:hypothetical protein